MLRPSGMKQTLRKSNRSKAAHPMGTPTVVLQGATSPVSGLGNLRACCLPSFQSGTSRPWSSSVSLRAPRGLLALAAERPCTSLWPTVHLRWPSALADKTGFDRRHSVSSVLFEPRSLFSLHAGQRGGVRATLSSSVHGWNSQHHFPPSASAVPSTVLVGPKIRLHGPPTGFIRITHSD